VRVTLFEDVYAKTKTEREVDLDALARLVSSAKASAKHDLPLLKLATFGDRLTDKTSLRHDQNILQVYGVECDYDDEEVSFDQAVAMAKVAKVQVILYTSPSHTPSAPRWRALLPLSRQVLPELRSALADRANAVFNGCLAKETWTLSQAFYYGAVSSYFNLIKLDGTPLDLLEVDGLAFRKSQPKLDPEVEQAKSIDDLPVRIKRAIREGNHEKLGLKSRSELVFMVAIHLVRQGWTDERIASILLEPTHKISSHCLDQSDPKAYALRQAKNARVKALADWRRNAKGAILAEDQTNVKRAFSELGVQFSWNVFTAEGYVNGVGPRRKIDDHEVNELRLMVDREFGFLPSKDFFYDLIDHVTHASPVHPVKDYLSSLEWDGVERVGHPETHASWLTTYGGAEDSSYTRAVGRLILVAAVRRIYQPGCKFDEMLVLVDPQQGTDKSGVLRLLARREEWFTDSMPLAAREKEVIEHLAGRWIVENSELNGIKHNQVEEIKGFLSRQVDRARLAYGRMVTSAPRQCVFFGTTNSDSFLRDLQNRRFWPVRVTSFDLKAMERDVDQLWAEAAVAEHAGESIRLDPSLWALAAEYQMEYRQEEPWATEIAEVLQGRCGKLASNDAWAIIGKPTGQRFQHDNQRMGEAMRELGFRRKHTTVYGRLAWTYTKPNEDGYEPQIYVISDPLRPGKVFASYSVDGEDGYEVSKDDHIPGFDYVPDRDDPPF
jgi:hypothetical protein